VIVLIFVLLVAKLLMLLIIAACFFDGWATEHYYRWWCKYGSGQAWRRKNGLALKSIPKEPWLGRWAFTRE
jgi:hypothetical protein